jgi:hypothetical protein
MKFLIKISLLSFFCMMLACQNSSDQQENTETENTKTISNIAPNTLSEEEETYGWELLFDGKLTENWKGYNQESFPSEGWKVADGMLIIEKSGTGEAGLGGSIVTKEKYENFELTIDFMLTDTANSGILYMVNEVEGSEIWHNAPEYQILDDARYAEMGSTNIHFTAANYDMHPAETDFKKPMGEWNTARIIKNKEHVEHWLNGNKVLEYDLWTPEWEAKVKASKFKDYPGYGRTKNGQIGIQDHGYEVRFRNLKIRSI